MSGFISARISSPPWPLAWDLLQGCFQWDEADASVSSVLSPVGGIGPALPPGSFDGRLTSTSKGYWIEGEMMLPSSVSLSVPRGWQKQTPMQGRPLGIDSSLLYYRICLAGSVCWELIERGASLPGGLSAQHTAGATGVMGDGQASRRTIAVSRMRPLLWLQNEWVWLSDVSSIATLGNWCADLFVIWRN